MSKEQETLLLHLFSHFVSAFAVFRQFGISVLTLFLATFDLCSKVFARELLQVKGLDLLSCDFMSGSWGAWGSLRGRVVIFCLRAPFIWGYQFMNLPQQFLVCIHILNDFSIAPKFILKIFIVSWPIVLCLSGLAHILSCQ